MLEKQRRRFWIFWICVFAVAFLILCFCGYSDGDDIFFLEHAQSMGFLEYLGWRYETWVGRMAAEALVYLTFRLGLWFWRPVNALMIVLLPLGVLTLAAKVARGAGIDLPKRVDELESGAVLSVVCGYFLMDIFTVGYAAIWVNGSIFYTWSFTCGIWALTVVADFVNAFTGVEKTEGSIRISMDGCSWKRFCFTIPCAIVASMSIEQMGAVLLTFEVLAILYGLLLYRRMHPLLLAQTIVTIASFAVLFAAPGNDLRVAEEIVTWLPFYDTMSFGEHLFITVHWLISSFANQNRLFLCGIWIAGGLLLIQKSGKNYIDYLFAGLAGVFTVAALLPYAGVNVFSDMGIQYLLTGRLELLLTWELLTGKMRFAMIWWGIALVFTLVFLRRVSRGEKIVLLAYLAGIASEAILFFSPTMYASGARIFYLTDLLYLFIVLVLIFGLREKKTRYAAYGMVLVLGIVNVVSPYSIWWYLPTLLRNIINF